MLIGRPKEALFLLKSYPVLFVDDEQVALDLFRHNFQEEFEVFTARSALEALEILKVQEIALVLSDQRMPGMSGTEFFAEIQKTHPEIIRILVTAYADMKTVVAAINAGHVYHYVEKPWDDEELRITLRRALEHFHLVRERDRLQAERIQTLEKMARSNRLAAVGTLAAGIAHEIRNPLSAILTFHQMLPEKLLQMRQDLQARPAALTDVFGDEFWTRFAQIPLREVERIKGLVQELLDFSRDSGNTYEMRKVQLKDLVEEVLPIVESDLRRVEIDLIRDYAPDFPWLEAAPDKLKQVVINLLLNAMHATPPGGKVVIGLHEISPTHIELSIADTGCGIDPENVERVFDPFFSTRDPGLGTGLGLTMVHHIVTNHGGEISLESETGKGTKVRVRLPILTGQDLGVNPEISDLQ